MPRGVKQEWESWSKGWLSPPGGSSTTTTLDTNPGTGYGPKVNNNKERHPPYWNDDPHACWLGLLNVSYAYIDRHQERVLIDSGARCNAVLLEYAKACKMRVGPVHKLATSPQEIPIQGIAGNTNALGYVVINVLIGGIPSYNEEQVALVIQDISGLGMRVLVILEMPTIHRLCHQMKESEIEFAPDEWQHALCSYEAAQGIFLQAMTPGTDNEDGVKYPTNTRQNPMDLDEPIILTQKVIIPAFASQIVKACIKKTFVQGHRLNVMVQTPYPEDEARLPVGLYIQHVYTELKDGS